MMQLAVCWIATACTSPRPMRWEAELAALRQRLPRWQMSQQDHLLVAELMPTPEPGLRSPCPSRGRQIALLHEFDEAAHLGRHETAVRIEGIEPHLPLLPPSNRGPAPPSAAHPHDEGGLQDDALVVAGGPGQGHPVVGAKGALGRMLCSSPSRLKTQSGWVRV